MKLLRLVILGILFPVLIITVISLFIPSNIQIAKAVLINAPADTVLNQLKDPQNWKHWYPGADSSKFFYENDLPRGLMLNEKKHEYILITGTNDNEVTAQYSMPGRKIMTGWVVHSINSNEVMLQWYMKFHLRWYPWEKFTSFLFDRVYGPQLQTGLNNIKERVEKQ